MARIGNSRPQEDITMTIWAILPAAGIGRRMGSETPKQYLPVNGVPIISVALRRLASVAAIQKIVVVLHPADRYWADLEVGLDLDLGDRLVCTSGGDERHQSVLNGLTSIQSEVSEDDWVLVHDAVRPCVRTADIEQLIIQLQDHAVGGLLGSPVDNTLKQVDEQGLVQATVNRNNYWHAYTPQMFRYGVLLTAIEQTVGAHCQVTDEAAAVELLGYQPKMIEGSKDNIKITHESDLILASKILDMQAAIA